MPSIAIIGCGLIGQMHAECLASLGNPPVLFADQNITRAEELATRYSGRASSDPLLAIADPDIEAVYICTYHDTHADFAVHAARHGKQIFLEKPMALTGGDCDRIVSAVREAQVRCMSGFKLHYYSLVEQARRTIERPLVLTGQVFDKRWPEDSWANDPVKGGGNVLSQGCHMVDLLCYFSNSKPVSIFAEGGNLHHPDNDIIDTMTATIRFESGCVANLTIADAGQMPHDGKFTLAALDGVRSIHLYDRLTGATYFDGSDSHEWSAEEDGFLRENEEFLNALRDGRAPFTNEVDGMRATKILLAGIESIRTREPQSLEHL